MSRVIDRGLVFRRLHQSGCFIIPNPWDLGSARALVRLGFPALATTSSGFAWTLGRRDNRVSLEEALTHMRAIAGGVEVPVNADFEGGFAVEPDKVAVNVAAAATTGVAGLSIEDSTGNASGPLFDFELAVERIRAARQAIDDSRTGIVLTGRSEGFIVGRPDLAETIRRLRAYAEAVTSPRWRHWPPPGCGGSASGAHWPVQPGPVSSRQRRRSPTWELSRR